MKQSFLLLLFGISLSFLLLLTACAAGSQSGTETAAEARFVVCNEECVQRGQCGQNEGGEWVVLGHTDSPHTDNHNILFSANQQVFVSQIQDRQLEIIQSGQQLSLQFYYVNLPDQSKAGWVAGWCVASQP
ncbi:MAG: hypothetical protein R6X32_01325 [Chloroflexota bacterium]|jgi:hypothetical protein